MTAAALCAIVSLAGMVFSSSAVIADETSSVGIVSEMTTSGDEIYRITCSVCHGERGDAESFAAKAFKPQPRDFTDPANLGVLTIDRMLDAVRNGRPKTAMQPFKDQLTDEQITAVIDYIRSTFMKIDIAAEKKTQASR